MCTSTRSRRRPLHGHGVVVVLGGAGVDGEREPVAQVAARRRTGGAGSRGSSRAPRPSTSAGNGRRAPASPARAVQQRRDVPRRAEPLHDARPAAARRQLHQHQLALVRDRAAPAERQRLAGRRGTGPRRGSGRAARPRSRRALKRRQTRRNLRIVRPRAGARRAPRPAISEQDRDLPEGQRTDACRPEPEASRSRSTPRRRLVRAGTARRPRRSRRAPADHALEHERPAHEPVGRADELHHLDLATAREDGEPDRVADQQHRGDAEHDRDAGDAPPR